jgi:hypothetical protein
LSALAASLLAGSTAPDLHPANDSTPRLLRFVAPFVFSVTEHSSAVQPYIHAPAEALALTATPFRRSLWLMASFVAIDFVARRHQREFLRC